MIVSAAYGYYWYPSACTEGFRGDPEYRRGLFSLEFAGADEPDDLLNQLLIKSVCNYPVSGPFTVDMPVEDGVKLAVRWK